uniref:glutamate synthase-related protein n=1 Tax=Sphingorhabdus sp. TaxID=1902408 RepID=UPI0035930511
MNRIDLLSSIFIFTIGVIVLLAIILFVVDITQTKDAVRRNYPVIGRFRSLFTSLGEFFRQYFFAMDREEMPFNRAERDWVDRATHPNDNTIAFGSTKNLTPVGTAIFMNCAFPMLNEDAVEMQLLEIGPNCRVPYQAPSFFNISGMSFGALSSPAVLALSKGAKIVGCWMNTGEGGLSPYHLEGGADIVMQIGTAKYGVRDQNGALCDEKLRE